MDNFWIAEQKKFLGHVKECFPGADLNVLEQAFEFGVEAHREQLRKSGDPYFTHCVAVANEISDMRLDITTVIAALLHDVVEDTGYTIQEVSEKFDPEVATLVDGVTKIGVLTSDTVEIRQAENFRKMLLSMVKDIRVILIKFADRLHNMRTIEFLPPLKQEKIARETLDVYAPLAHRLGIARVRWELEDLSFKILEPEAYKDLVQKLQEKKFERDAYIAQVMDSIAAELQKAKINGSIYGRSKSYFSIYRKIQIRGVPFEDIFDLTAIRVIVDKIEDCYHALGIAHTLFPPVPERFKDYIATPKLNGYQSIHTTVVGPGGRPVEIQIRTKDMHRTAEIGIAAHWRYKEGKMKEEKTDRELDWLRTILEFQEDSEDPVELLENLKIDLFHDEVFVFTPKGDLIKLPQGATPIDFAFAVHSDVGMHCIGAKIGGKIVPLTTPLKSGFSVAIITSSNQHPHPDWIKFVKTAKARGHIKRWLQSAQGEEHRKLGEEILFKEIARLNLKDFDGKLKEIPQSFGCADLDSLYRLVGRGDLPVQNVIKRLAPESAADKKEEIIHEKITKRLKGTPYGVMVEGMDSFLINFARCCRPVPGDKIVGFLTRSKGVTVHRANCKNLLNLLVDPDRSVTVEWDTLKGKRFLVGIRIIGEDRRKFLHDITEAISNSDVSILSGTLSVEDSYVSNTFLVEVKDIDHLMQVMRTVSKVKGVISVERFSGITEE